MKRLSRWQRLQRAWRYRRTGHVMVDREVAILRLAAAGRTNQQIAHELGVASDTVKKAMDTIRGKLDAVDRTNAVAIAIRKGVIS